MSSFNPNNYGYDPAILGADVRDPAVVLFAGLDFARAALANRQERLEGEDEQGWFVWALETREARIILDRLKDLSDPVAVVLAEQLASVLASREARG